MSTLHDTSYPAVLRRALRVLAWEWYSMEWSDDGSAVCFFCRQRYDVPADWTRNGACDHLPSCVVSQCRRALHPEEVTL